MLALVLGLIVSAGVYHAYLWPSVEPSEPGEREAAIGGPSAGGAPATPDRASAP